MVSKTFWYWVNRFWELPPRGEFSEKKAEQFINELIARGKTGGAYVAAYAIKSYAKEIKGIDLEISNIPRLERKIPEVLEHDEALRIIQTAGLYHLRDCAIMSLLYDAGLRVSELTGLNISDVDLEGQKVFVRKRKGHIVPQLIPFGARTRDILQRYLSTFPVSVSNTAFETPLFLGRESRLSDNQVGKIVRSWGERVLGRKIHPHTLRHSYAVRMREAGLDILDIADLLGHQNIATTRLYARMRPGLSEERYQSPLDLG